MKKTSQFLTILIAVMLLISTLAVLPVSAASSVTYTASSVSGKTGDTVTVNVSVSGGSNLWGCRLSLLYDSSKLQYVSSSQGALYSAGSIMHNSANSEITFAGQVNTSKISGGGVIYSVKFKILATSGSTTVTMKASGSGNNIDSNGQELAFSTKNGTVSVTVPVTSITLNKTSATLKKGEKITLTSTVSPSNATNKSVTYTTSNSKVATVNSSGVVTAVSGGTATITAKSGGKTATCKVSVTVTQTGISASGSTAKTVSEDSTLKLTVVKVPSDATDSYKTTWTSSNPSVATVSSDGTVKGVSQGTADITANVNGWTVTYKITVKEKAAEESTTNSDETVTGEGSLTEIEESTLDAEPTTEIFSAESTTASDDSSKSKGFIALMKDDIVKRWKVLTDENNKVTKIYHYAMLLGVSVFLIIISVTVTFLVTSGYYKNKMKKEREKNAEDSQIPKF